MTREKAIKIVKEFINDTCLHLVDQEALETLIPELAENEDERIRKCLCDIVNWLGFDSSFFLCNGVAKTDVLAYLEKQKDSASNNFDDVWNEEDCEEIIAEGQKLTPRFKELLKEVCHAWYDRGAKLEKQKEQKPSIFPPGLGEVRWNPISSVQQKPIKMEVYEVGRGTTVCGQDYKCKKDYQVGNCWYIKDVIYHCSRDGYLNDQNGVSWSCTPEWFKEYIYTNSELADKEKNDFVSGQFIQCKLSFKGFKEGEHYWLEYIGDDMYVGRSDNILNQKFHITPRQLYTLFSQQLEEVQGPPQEEKQASLNYEPPFNENPSDKEIIEALIKHLKEQDGFLTAINCVSTKAILSWLEKQQEQKPLKVGENAYFDPNTDMWFIKKEQKPIEPSDDVLERHQKELYDFKVFAAKQAKEHRISFVHDFEWNNFCAELLSYFNEKQKPVDYETELKKCKNNPLYFFDKYVSIKQKPAEWSEEDERMLKEIITIMDGGKVTSGTYLSEYVAWLKSLHGRFNLEPKQEWSEEDEHNFNSVINLVHAATDGAWGSCIGDRIENWLKNLPERFNLQPKPEWSEEDEKMLQSIIKDFRAGKVSTIGQERWLKSLRPQYHGDVTMTEAYKMGVEAGKASSWKPSKEQMDALDKAIPVCMGVVGRDEIMPLESLCEQLKKL